MLFTCTPPGARIPGRFLGPAHARGKWFTIDIHCHLLTPKAEEMVAGAGLSMDWQPRHQFANEHTKEVNREQTRRTRVQFTDVATTTSTRLTFTFREDPDYWFLDNVSVSSGGTTPEPGPMVLFGSGLVGIAGVIRRKFRV